VLLQLRTVAAEAGLQLVDTVKWNSLSTTRTPRKLQSMVYKSGL